MDIVKFINKRNGLIYEAKVGTPSYDAMINTKGVEIIVVEEPIEDLKDLEEDLEDLEEDQTIEVAGKEVEEKVELDLEAMTVKELNKLAKELGLTGYADLNKPELIIFIESSL